MAERSVACQGQHVTCSSWIMGENCFIWAGHSQTGTGSLSSSKW